MWTRTLREYHLHGSWKNSNLVANIDIYDETSEKYLVHARQNPGIAKRVRSAVKKLLAEDSQNPPVEGRRHLDFGCGPGQVLAWLDDYNSLQVGLDVSLVNLRTARRRTGAFVVCGDATLMPFVDHSFDLVTESSALHHIEDWKAAVREACRICAPRGSVLLDAEPTREQMAWGRLARLVFDCRLPIYKALSYVRKDRYMFRNLEQAKLNLKAEIHHQPGTGFPLTELIRLFEAAGFAVDIVVSPTPELLSKASPSWKRVVLDMLSWRNPWNPKYGAFTALARSKAGTMTRAMTAK